MKYDIKTGKTKQSNITSIIFKQTSQILQQYFDNNINFGRVAWNASQNTSNLRPI